MKESTWQPILDLIREKEPVRTVEIVRASGLSEVRVHAVLKYLLEHHYITKSGAAPVVYYEITHQGSLNDVGLSNNQKQLLDDEYLFIDASGKRFDGVAWFLKRCEKVKVDPQKKAADLADLLQYVSAQKNGCGVLSAYQSFEKKVSDPQLDELFFMEVYQLLEFGKSKLASIAYYAKQMQSTALMKEIIRLTAKKIKCLQRSYTFDAVCYVPRSLPREKQLMTSLRYGRDIKLPHVTLTKAIRDVVVPQKSLKTTQERIRNASETLLVPEGAWSYNHLLLIDDFVGSGWTMNESARKLKANGVAKKITWLALVGNIDMSYDVIREI